MTILLKLANNNLDNDIVFYGVLIGVIGAIGYSFTKQILSKSYTDQSVQTDAVENYSDIPDQIIEDDVSSIGTLSPVSSTSSIETLSPMSSTFKYKSPLTSEVGTQTIAGDVTQVIPNQDIVGRVVDLSNAEYLAAKAEQLNALDPFLATP
jgi:hypothetical protein